MKMNSYRVKVYTHRMFLTMLIWDLSRQLITKWAMWMWASSRSTQSGQSIRSVRRGNNPPLSAKLLCNREPTSLSIYILVNLLTARRVSVIMGMGQRHRTTKTNCPSHPNSPSIDPRNWFSHLISRNHRSWPSQGVTNKHENKWIRVWMIRIQIRTSNRRMRWMDWMMGPSQYSASRIKMGTNK